MSADDMSDYAPRSTAEVLRNIPGIQSEASSGDANANAASSAASVPPIRRPNILVFILMDPLKSLSRFRVGLSTPVR